MAVYVIQEAPGRNILSAEKYGELNGKHKIIKKKLETVKAVILQKKLFRNSALQKLENRVQTL